MADVESEIMAKKSTQVAAKMKAKATAKILCSIFLA